MNWQAVSIGVLAALVVSLSKMIHSFLLGAQVSPGVLIFGVGAVAIVLQKWVLDHRSGDSQYSGLSDLLIHVHAPISQGSGLRWTIRGVISFLLTLVGGTAGPEGAAIEFSQALQMKMDPYSSRWFEQKRRTHVVSSLAASVSAAFGAPFTGILLPMELGVGGRGLSAVVSALVAFLLSQFLTYQFSLETFDVHGVFSHFHITNLREWMGIALVGVMGGVLGAVFILFTRYTQESLLALFQTRTWMKVLAGAALLGLVHWLGNSTDLSSAELFEGVLWSRFTPTQVTLLFFTQFLSLSLLIAGFGSAGWLWPLFSLGGLFGYCFYYWALQPNLSYSIASGLAAGAALWGAVLNAPIAGAVLAFELTQNIQILLPALLAGLIGARLCRRLKIGSLIEQDLKARGSTLFYGRSQSILDSITASTAMVTDYEVIYEQESITEIQPRVLQSTYPFLPVVNSEGKFRGLLTADQFLHTASGQPIEKFIEAKDLVYSLGAKTPTVRISDSLTAIIHLFDNLPCVPVLKDDQTLVGLLFAYHVRLAYDREVGRRSLDFMSKV